MNEINLFNFEANSIVKVFKDSPARPECAKSPKNGLRESIPGSPFWPIIDTPGGPGKNWLFQMNCNLECQWSIIPGGPGGPGIGIYWDPSPESPFSPFSPRPLKY